MVAVPLGLHAYDRERVMLPASRLVNMYLEKDETGASPDETLRIQRPGLRTLHNLLKPIRSLYQSNGVESGLTLIVAGDELWSSDGANATKLATGLANDGLSATIVATFERVVILSAGQLYQWNGSSVTEIAMVDDLNVISVEVSNSYIIAGISDGRFFWLAPASNTFDPLDFATAEGLPDGLLTIKRLRDDIFLMGSRSIEVWQSTGDPDSLYQRAPGRLIDRGCHASDTVQSFDNSLVWVGEDGVVYRVQDVPTRISTHAIEEAIRKRSDDCSAFVFSTDAHLFYVLKIPSQGTFAYDASTQQWCEFSTMGQPTWRPTIGINTPELPLCGDQTGKVFAIDPEVSSDDGQPFVTLISGVIPLANVPIRNSSFSMYAGVSSDCQIRLRYKDSVGDWSQPYVMSAGEGSSIVNWWRLGAGRGAWRHYEISILDPVLVRIAGAKANEGWSNP